MQQPQLSTDFLPAPSVPSSTWLCLASQISLGRDKLQQVSFNLPTHKTASEVW